MAAILAGLTWEPNIKGGLYVAIAIVILCGSVQLILSTNVGARLGFQLAGAGLTGFFVIIGSVWWVYGIGPKGPDPTWKPQAVVSGDPANVADAGAGEVLAGFPDGWTKLDLTDPAVADAQSVVDLRLTEAEGGEAKLFDAATDYLTVAAATRGGKAYGPLGLNFRPFDVFHTPHYLTIAVQPVVEQKTEPGKAPPKARVDSAAKPVSVLMLRDQGRKRLHPAVFTISSLLIFGLLVNQLHVRDKELLAQRAQSRA